MNKIFNIQFQRVAPQMMNGRELIGLLTFDYKINDRVHSGIAYVLSIKGMPNYSHISISLQVNKQVIPEANKTLSELWQRNKERALAETEYRPGKQVLPRFYNFHIGG